ncbi:response regulator transcription factor [Cohnella hongkongensis]|uniref:Response regulator n=1 Tax=Cohnella hongkongensis TaxID=178337 RepID=A0ABV9FG77_9BACL
MYKLLVVDDHIDTRDTLSSCFPWDQVSFEIVHQSDNGLEALQYLMQHPVDVVLCDIKMPKMNGIELAREVHDRQIPARMILLSAYRDFEYARHAIAYGVRQYLIKPAKYHEIMDVFNEMKAELDKGKGDPQPDNSAAFGSETAGAAAMLEGQDDPIIRKIVGYVRKHYPSAKLEQAARLVHMNPTYVSSYFKKLTGVNFSEFVLTCKMERAAELLTEQKWKTFQVSEMVGYSNVKNFIRTFKDYFGQTPGQYRRQQSN